MNSFFLKVITLCSIILLAISCDKDVNDIGANIVGEDHFGFMSDNSSTVFAYTQKTDEVQTNNLEINQLGIYDNPTFGKTTSSFAVQMLLDTIKPTLSTPVVTSVILDIPYFSKVVDNTVADVDKTYTLDSIYGDKTQKIKLSIFRSNSEINQLHPTGLNLRYFSNSIINTTGTRLNDDADTTQNDEFVFRNIGYSKTVATTTGTTTTYYGPSLRVNLNNSFGTAILNAGASLNTNADFINEFKGLYFKAEQSGSAAGCMAMLNIKKGSVTINFDEGAKQRSVRLSMIGSSVNVFDQINNTNYSNKIANPNTTSGDDRLYLKGGKGSVALINLFGNTNVVKYNRTTQSIEPRTIGDDENTPDELDYLKAKGWIINEANLVFNIDQGAMASAIEPNRVMLYNANNKLPLIDYYYDNSVSTATNYGQKVHDGIIQKVAGKGNKYRIRITNYIRNLINKDSTNVKLALAVCQNIRNTSFVAKDAPNNYWTSFTWLAKSKYERLDYTATFFPNSSITNPLGTVLYGTNVAPADNDKKIKLEIWYTKPN